MMKNVPKQKDGKTKKYDTISACFMTSRLRFEAKIVPVTLNSLHISVMFQLRLKCSCNPGLNTFRIRDIHKQY